MSGTHVLHSDQGLNPWDQHTTTSDTNQIQAYASLKSPSQIVNQTSIAETSHVRVTTTVATQQCARLCPCQCHMRSHRRSPTWLTAAIGQLLFSYHDLLRTTPCNYPLCRKTPRKTEFTYYFPYWIAQKALMLSFNSDLSGRAASILMTMPVIIPGGHSIWYAVQNGNIPFIQQLFGQGLNPHIIDQHGNSLVMVRTAHTLCIGLLYQMETGAFTPHSSW